MTPPEISHTEADNPNIPRFTLGDRLRKAREHARISAGAMADELGVSRQTVSNYENDHVRVDRRTLISWSFTTGVPIKWLETGAADAYPAPPTTGGESVNTPTPAPRRAASTRRANSRCSSATPAELGVLPRAS